MIMKYRTKHPKIEKQCFVADNATVIGDVVMEEGASVWFHTVVRGDMDRIHIGRNSNIQDNSTLHTDPQHILEIGENVTVGHNAVLHGCGIADACLIGMGAIILNGASIGTHSIIGAGALVMEHQCIPSNSVAVGCPAKVVKQISEEQVQEILANAKHYAQLAQEYKEMQATKQES